MDAHTLDNTIATLKIRNESSIGRFEKKSSLIIKISLLYLALTLINLLVIWLALGANQMRLISDKATWATRSTSFELLRRLSQVQGDIKKIDKFSDDNNEIKKIISALRYTEDSDRLIVPEFHFLNIEADILYSYPSGSLKTYDRPDIQRKVFKALQMKETHENAFYGVPNIQDYAIEIFIPMDFKDGKQILFFSRIKMESIRTELITLFIIALIVLFIMLLIQTILGFGIYNMVIKPVVRLSHGAAAVADGNLDVNIPVGKKTDELGLLTHLFNRMVISLNEKTQQLQQTIEELERHNEIIQNELKMAQNIQSGMMPSGDISERIRVGVYYSPLGKVSGDYYDIFPLSDGSLGILITDASGHGVPAALVTIMAKVHFSTLVDKYNEPGELLARVNTELSKAIITSDYLTAFYLIIRPDLRVDFCNASHQKALILRHGTGMIDELDSGGFFIGAVEESPFPYETHHTHVDPMDRIILYTDGIVEGTNMQGEEYSYERFLEKIKEHYKLPVREFVDILIKDVDEFANGAERKDDYTLFAFDILGERQEYVNRFDDAAKAYNEGNFQKTREIMTQILHDEPDNHMARLHMGNACFLLKEYKEAIENFSEYIMIRNSDPYVFLKLGVCYSRIGDEKAAIEMYQKALQINQNISDAYSRLAFSYMGYGEYYEAIKNIDKALQLRPGDPSMLAMREKATDKLSKEKGNDAEFSVRN